MRIGLDEQGAATETGQRAHDLPGVFRMMDRIGPDQPDLFVAEIAGRPDRAVLRIDEIGAAAGMGLDPDLDDLHQLVVLGVDHSDLVRGVGGDQEIAAGGVEAAVMQEARGVDGCGLEIVEIGIIDQDDLARLFHIDHEFGW